LFKYIFAGCYALRFHLGRFQLGRRKYIIRQPIFLNTSYERVEAVKPQVTCRYKDIEYSNLEKRYNNKVPFIIILKYISYILSEYFS